MFAGFHEATHSRATGLRSPRAGFAMIDAMVAMLVVVFAIASMIPLAIAMVASSDIGRQNMLAYSATRQIIENVRSHRATTFPNGTYAFEAFGPVPQLSQMKNPTGSVVLQTASGSNRVLVRILWRSGARGGATRSFEAVSNIAPRGVTP